MQTQENSFSSASVTRTAALSLVEAAIEAAESMGAEITVAIVDPSGNLKAFARMDGAQLLTVEIAIDKAWTAASSGMPTHQWTSLISEHPNLAQFAHRPRLVAVAGGYPLLDEERLLGGIGISGGRHLQDRQIAEAAIASLKLTIPERFRLGENNL